MTETPGTAFGYSNDPAANRSDVAVNGVPATHHDYDAADQVVGWSYDAAANVISDTARSYTYDALNRLTGLTAGPEQQTYAYNGDGVLLSQTVNVVGVRGTSITSVIGSAGSCVGMEESSPGSISGTGGTRSG